MTVREALQEGARALSQAREAGTPIDTPYLDAVVLLAEALRIEKERLYASLREELPEILAGRYAELLALRRRGVPVSYIRGTKEFFGREFSVDRRVLVPRPETEILVETAIELIDSLKAAGRPFPAIHDVGTGSGAIALTVKLERPEVEVTASDLSAEAGEVFRLNAARLRADVAYHEGSLLRGPFGSPEHRGRSFDLIVSNPPYLSDVEVDAMVAAGWPEPERALRGGPAGLDVIGGLIAESVDFLRNGSYLLIEIASWQAERVSALMRERGYDEVTVRRDLSGGERAVIGRLDAPPVPRVRPDD